MLDAAFRQVATAVSGAVGGPYHPAVLHYPGVPIKDDGGTIIDPGTPYEVECQAQVDVATEAMRQSEGFLEKDVRLLILGPDALDTVPELAVTEGPFAGQRYVLHSAQRDSMGFAWECRGRAA